MKTWIPLICTVAMTCVFAGKVRADPQVLFEDNFAAIDPSLSPDFAFQVKAGKAVLTIPANRFDRIIYQVGFFTDADLSLTATYIAGDSQANSSCGIIFWAIDSNNFYSAVVEPDSSAYIFRYSGSRWLTPATVAPSPTVNKGLGTSNLLRIVTKGNRATLYINGTQVTAITGMPPAGGGLVGVYAQSNTVLTTWTAQDFKVLSVP
jgi:hypothetical protein